MKSYWRSFLQHKKQKSFFVLVGGLIAINIALGGYLFTISKDTYPEIAALQGNKMGFSELSKYYVDLAKEKGAVYSFDVMKRAYISPNTDIHLLAHGVGDVLYDQQGIDGILSCTDDFRNACSHQIVINALVERGPSAFPLIADTCKLAPGGGNAYTMCYHGLGHGVLAYNGYDLSKAMDMCNLSGKKAGEEAVECMGGAAMEMMAGVHDVAMWKSESVKYFDENDPLAPCNRKSVPQEAKRICYIYLTPHLFKAGGAQPGKSPTDAQLTKAMSFCEVLSGSDRNACFGGFGKEYAPMSNNKDIRTMDSVSEEGFKKILRWCSLTDQKDGVNTCIVEGMRSLYWAGAVDPKIPARFCTLADQRGYGKSCIETFVGIVGYYIKDRDYRVGVCTSLPEKYQEFCRVRLL